MCKRFHCACPGVYTLTWRALSSPNGSPCEVLPASDQVQPGAGRHRVELGRRGVADRPRSQAHPLAVGELHEVAGGALLGGVVLGDRQHDLAVGHRAHGDDGAGAWRVLGHERLDDEHPGGGEPGGDGGEAGGLARRRPPG